MPLSTAFTSRTMSGLAATSFSNTTREALVISVLKWSRGMSLREPTLAASTSSSIERLTSVP